MSERDDLIDLIDGATWSLIDSDVVADAILAAGWVKATPNAPVDRPAILDHLDAVRDYLGH